MKIYDCFIFYNESMLLDIRLHTLADLVDKFVLVESTHTFSGEKKNLHYNEIKDTPPFVEFKDRIIHIVHNSVPSSNRWLNQTDQRNAIALGLRKADPEDIIIISDVDEIPNPHIFDHIKRQQEPTRLAQKLYYYYLNCQCETNWYKALFCRYKNYAGADNMRNNPDINRALLNGGWHYSYLMAPENIAHKISRLSQAEYDTDYYKDVNRIKSCVANHADLFERSDLRYAKVELDAPPYVMNNREKFEKFIL